MKWSFSNENIAHVHEYGTESNAASQRKRLRVPVRLKLLDLTRRMTSPHSSVCFVFAKKNTRIATRPLVCSLQANGDLNFEITTICQRNIQRVITTALCASFRAPKRVGVLSPPLNA